jgi:hypothetical protein
VFYSITSRRKSRPDEFKEDMATVFGFLRDGAIHSVVVDRLPLAGAREAHERIDAGVLGRKIVLLAGDTRDVRSLRLRTSYGSDEISSSARRTREYPTTSITSTSSASDTRSAAASSGASSCTPASRRTLGSVRLRDAARRKEGRHDVAGSRCYTNSSNNSLT